MLEYFVFKFIFMISCSVYDRVSFCSLFIQSYVSEKCPCWLHIYLWFIILLSSFLSYAMIYLFSFWCTFRLLEVFHCDGNAPWVSWIPMNTETIRVSVCACAGASPSRAPGSGVVGLRVCALRQSCLYLSFCWHAAFSIQLLKYAKWVF